MFGKIRARSEESWADMEAFPTHFCLYISTTVFCSPLFVLHHLLLLLSAARGSLHTKEAGPVQGFLLFKRRLDSVPE